MWNIHSIIASIKTRRKLLNQFFPQIFLTTRHPVVHPRTVISLLSQISSGESEKRRVKRSTSTLPVRSLGYLFVLPRCHVVVVVVVEIRPSFTTRGRGRTDGYAYRQRKRIDFLPLPLLVVFWIQAAAAAVPNPRRDDRQRFRPALFLPVPPSTWEI